MIVQGAIGAAPAPAPAAASSSRTGVPALPGWFAPGGPGNPVGAANPTLLPGAPIPGYTTPAGRTAATRMAMPGDCLLSANLVMAVAKCSSAWASKNCQTFLLTSELDLQQAHFLPTLLAYAFMPLSPTARPLLIVWGVA